MRSVHYSVAMSLDGYIASPDGGYEWIPEEPEIDWARFLGRFDTVLMGRCTWETVSAGGTDGMTRGDAKHRPLHDARPGRPPGRGDRERGRR